jgi:spore coat protein H
MKSTTLKSLMFILVFSFLCNASKPQSLLTSNREKLNLIQGDKKIEHVFNITLSKKDFKNLQKTKNISKNFISNCSIIYNSDSLNVNELKLRGKSSMDFKRKSFSVKLNQKVAFKKNGKIHKLKRFNLISLSMDQNYFRNKVAFDMMQKLDLFNLFYAFAEVKINNKTQGIYLIVEKPKDFALNREEAKFMLRRNYKNEIKKSYYKDNDSLLVPKFEEAFLKIYTETIQKGGKSFYRELAKVIDTEQYFRWMAFNYLVGNGDYTDEVFFYNIGDQKNIRFGIIPWDYDDIFMSHPHEGNLYRHFRFGDRLAFSSEDALDYAIITNDYSYKLYLQVLNRVTTKLSIETIKEVFESTFKELYPFYCKKDILNVSKIDKYGKSDLTSLKSSMNTAFDQLTQKREEISLQLNDVLSYE